MGDVKATVKIGGNEHTLREFSAFQAVVAGEILAQSSGKVEQLVNQTVEYRRNYQNENSAKISKGLAAMRGYLEPEGPIPLSAFDGVDYIELPQPPSREQVIAKVFPAAFKLAREEITKLVALVMCTDAQLLEADNSGWSAVEELLTTKGKELLHQARMSEYVALVNAAIKFSRDQLAEVEQDMGELRALIERSQTTPQPSSTSDADSNGQVDEEAIAVPVPLAGGLVSEGPADSSSTGSDTDTGTGPT